MKLRNKVFVITGSSSGIGAASAVAAAKHGAKIMLHGRKEEALKEVAKRCVAQGIPESHVSYVIGDVMEEETLTRIRDATLEKFGGIDVLFNNAGYSDSGDLPIHRGGTLKMMDDMYKLYIQAPFLLVKKFLPALERSRGVVVNCASGYSEVPDPNFTAYCTMKAGLVMMSKVLAMSLGMREIRVNCMNPGPVPTEIFNRRFGDGFNETQMPGMGQMSPLEFRLATPDEMADIFMFLASDDSASMSGEFIRCDMGLLQYYPVMGQLQ